MLNRVPDQSFIYGPILVPEARIASMLSMMSDSLWAGFLEGMDRVAQNTALEQRFQRSLIYDAARNGKEFVDINLQPSVLEDSDRPALIQFHQDVNVAFRSGFAPCHRAEHRGVRHRQPAQIFLVGAQRFKQVLEVQSRKPTKSLPEHRRRCAHGRRVRCR